MFKRLLGQTLYNPSLRVRLIQLVLLAALPALGFILYIAADERRTAVRAAENEALRVIRVIAESQRHLIENTRYLLLALSRLPEVRGDDARSCNTLFADLNKRYTVYSNLALANPEGDIICSAVPLKRPVNVADRPYFHEVLRRKEFVIGDYTVGRITGKTNLMVVEPVLNESGAVSRVVIAAVDLASLRRLAETANLPLQSALTIFDDHGTVLAQYPAVTGKVGSSALQSDIFRVIATRREGVAERPGLDGQRRLFGFTSIQDSSGRDQLYFTIGIPRQVALAAANRALMRNVTTLLVVTLLVLLASWYGADILVLRDINSLVRATESIAAGDLGARTGMSGRRNSLGRLSRSLDKMAEMLEARRNQLESANEQLRWSLQRSQALHEVRLAIVSTLELRPMLDILLEKIDLVLPNAITTVKLIDKHTGQLEPMACRHLDYDSWRREAPRAMQGLAKIVLEQRAPLFVENLQSDPRSAGHPFARRLGLTSYLGVPLVVKDEVLGIIAFYTGEKQFLDEKLREFLTELGRHFAMALSNARLYDDAKRRAEEITALHALTTAASQSLERHTVLSEAIRTIGEIFHFDAIRIHLFDSAEELRVKAEFEARPELWSSVNTIRRGASIVGRAAETGETFVFEDVLTDPRYAELSQTQAALKAGAHFLAVLPIKSKLKIWGTMVCAGERPRKLAPEELDLLISMTNQVGIALENATLFEETAARAAELSALYLVTTVAGESLDLRLVLERTTDKILEFLGFDGARIFVRDAASGELRLAIHKGIPETVPLATPREGRVGRVTETGETLFTEDMRNDPYYLKHSRKQNLLQAGFRSSCLIPITAGGEILGVMNFVGKSPHYFSDHEKNVIQAIAYHVGAAVRNANLYGELERKNAELQRADKAKEEFLGIVSHELRTPLNVITGYTDLILNRVFGELNAEQRHALRMISNQNQELLQMITSVLHATKFEADTMFAAPTKVALGHFLDKVKASFAILPPGKEALAVTWEYPTDLPVVLTDEEKLRIILTNLIHNAIKFTGRGKVTISVALRPEVEMIEFKITDTGAGIPEDKLPIIFDKFIQADSSLTRTYGGVGLGLFIAKKFTQLLGGSIGVRSKLGEGSTFTVALPMKKISGGLNSDEAARARLPEDPAGVDRAAHGLNAA